MLIAIAFYEVDAFIGDLSKGIMTIKLNALKKMNYTCDIAKSLPVPLLPGNAIGFWGKLR